MSRTFGDIEAKMEKFGRMKNVVFAMPDLKEIEINNEFNFIVIGCDGIFDVIENEELIECLKIVIKEKKELSENKDYRGLCKEFSNMIIKTALAKDSFDNISDIDEIINEVLGGGKNNDVNVNGKNNNGKNENNKKKGRIKVIIKMIIVIIKIKMIIRMIK